MPSFPFWQLVKFPVAWTKNSQHHHPVMLVNDLVLRTLMVEASSVCWAPTVPPICPRVQTAISSPREKGI